MFHGGKCRAFFYTGGFLHKWRKKLLQPIRSPRAWSGNNFYCSFSPLFWEHFFSSCTTRQIRSLSDVLSAKKLLPPSVVPPHRLWGWSWASSSDWLPVLRLSFPSFTVQRTECSWTVLCILPMHSLSLEVFSSPFWEFWLLPGCLNWCTHHRKPWRMHCSICGSTSPVLSLSLSIMWVPVSFVRWETPADRYIIWSSAVSWILCWISCWWSFFTWELPVCQSPRFFLRESVPFWSPAPWCIPTICIS